MAVKLIALDLDGTTLNSDNIMTDKTRETLLRAADLGIEVLPVTGRCYYSLPGDFFDIGGRNHIKYAITSNGAEIRDIEKGTVLYHDYISREGTGEIKSVLDKNDWMTEVYVKGRAFIEKSDYEKILNKDVEYRSRDYVLDTRKPVRGVKQLLDVHCGKIEKIAVYFPDTSIAQNIKDEFRFVKNAEITASGRNNLEFVALNCSKARTLRIMCCMLGIRLSETMAFGDSYNDLEMLKISGVSVAMGNSEDIVKKAADYITETNYNDGVAAFIVRMLQQNS